MTPRSSALVRAELVGVGDRLLEQGDHAGADRGVPGLGVGVEADHEPVISQIRIQTHLLDLQVVRHRPVASLA
jgi:hypothetical protein